MPTAGVRRPHAHPPPLTFGGVLRGEGGAEVRRPHATLTFGGVLRVKAEPSRLRRLPSWRSKHKRRRPSPTASATYPARQGVFDASRHPQGRKWKVLDTWKREEEGLMAPGQKYPRTPGVYARTDALIPPTHPVQRLSLSRWHSWSGD